MNLMDTMFQKDYNNKFNSISLETLEDAQNKPVIYKDLMVRVSGYSARYTELPRAVQDDIKV